MLAYGCRQVRERCIVELRSRLPLVRNNRIDARLGRCCVKLLRNEVGKALADRAPQVRVTMPKKLVREANETNASIMGVIGIMH